MLEHAWQLGVPMNWVTGDSVYGESTPLRQAIERAGKWYVLAVTSLTRVWRERPALLAPAEQTGGRPRRKVRLAPGAPKPQTVADVMAQVPRRRWRRLSVGLGAKGARIYDWAGLRVIESRDDLPGPEVWLLARRSVSQPDELAYYLAYYLAAAPRTLPLQRLAQVASTRYTVEQCIEEAKGGTGFDRYEVRTWPSWYRHITLSMLAHAWLADRRSQEVAGSGEKSSAERAERARSAAVARDRPAAPRSLQP
jgi:SRSO17 transposase